MRRASPGLLASLLLMGCYQYVPLASTPVAGIRASLMLTDQGRVGLASRIGPGVARIEGAVVTASDSDVLLAVSDVYGINGIRSPWAGESVRVERPYVAIASERRLSRAHTAIVTVGLSAVVVVLIASRDLLGFGGGDLPGGGGGGNNQ